MFFAWRCAPYHLILAAIRRPGVQLQLQQADYMCKVQVRTSNATQAFCGEHLYRWRWRTSNSHNLSLAASASVSSSSGVRALLDKHLECQCVASCLRPSRAHVCARSSMFLG